MGKSVVASHFRRQYSNDRTHFKLENVLLLQKLSRFEVERLRRPDYNDEELESSISARGIDVQAMRKHHDIQANFLKKVQDTFKRKGLCIRTVNRFNYTESDIEWCDSVFPVGGDGTFLLAASRILNRNKPVIGLNSDPCRSEGHLCLPQKYSSNLGDAVDKLLMGEFRWLFRSRIRVSLSGNKIHGTPTELHDQALRIKVSDIAADQGRIPEVNESEQGGTRVLPVLALNEVFLGEVLSAKVSYFEIKSNGKAYATRTKCSGLCVCTGTGSSSWNLSMNRFSQNDVHDIVKLYASAAGHAVNESLVEEVCQKFNQRFLFEADDSRMGYTIRDLICAAVWPKPKNGIEARGFVSRMEIKSRCSDAGLVIDGGISFPFNDGTTAILELRPEDSLRTVILTE